MRKEVIGDATLYLSDCIAAMKSMPDNSVDSVVTDPPYHLTSIVKRFGGKNAAPAQQGTDGAYARASRGFMGKEWDGGDIAFRPELWAEVLRVLKPGGHLLAFSGSRTYHRMACAIEDAGFEIRDQIMWLYGSGFPKSHDVSKGIDRAAGVEFKASPAEGVGFMGPEGPGGYNVTKNRLTRTGESTESAKQWLGWGTSLKPAHEPICMARKPLDGTVAQNCQEWGTGALNIDECRISVSKNDPESFMRGERAIYGKRLQEDSNSVSLPPSTLSCHALGRWPANVIHDGSAECINAFPQDMGASAARFFYCAKASQQDRDEGLHGFSGQQANFGDSKVCSLCKLTQRHAYEPQNIGKCEHEWIDPEKKNVHPTVKPTDLMRYLVRLVTRKGGICLDPFMGSGSTGKAAILEKMQFIGIDMTEEYFEIAKARIEYVEKGGMIFHPEDCDGLKQDSLF